MKKGVVPVKAAFFLTATLFGIILFSAVVNAPLVCNYKNTPCAANEVKVLGLSNNTNAHAEVPSQTNYGWNVCCKVQGASATLTTSVVSSSNTCPAGTDSVVTGLSSSDGSGTTNAHLENPGSDPSGPPHKTVCISADSGTVLCRAPINEPCPSDEECLFSQSSIYNAHGADCNAATSYDWKKCCRYSPIECGAEGQPCCSGLCQHGLFCDNNVCEPWVGPPCGNGVPDPGETCENCPQDICPGTLPATVWGYVTNLTVQPVAGAKVALQGKVSGFTDAAGRYELTVDDASAGSPYDIVASASSYESELVPAFDVSDGVTIQKDFTLIQYRGDCTDGCKKVGSNLCSKDCNGKGFCLFYSQATMDACDGTFGWTEMPDGQYVNCCKGKPFTPLKADVSVPCASNVVKIQKIVLYSGKFVKMNILTFVPDLCPRG